MYHRTIVVCKRNVNFLSTATVHLPPPHTPPLPHTCRHMSSSPYIPLYLSSPHSLPNGGSQISPPMSSPLPPSPPSSLPHTPTSHPYTLRSLYPMRGRYHYNTMQGPRVRILSYHNNWREEREQWLHLRPKGLVLSPHCRVEAQAPRAYCDQGGRLLQVGKPLFLTYRLVGCSLELFPLCLKRAL